MKIALAVLLSALTTSPGAAAGRQGSADDKPPQAGAVVEAGPATEAPVRNRGLHNVVRIGADFTQPPDDQSGNVVVIAGRGALQGGSRDAVVIFGTADLASTTDIRGSLVLIGTDAKVAQGARVRDDLVVIGGTFQAPPDFQPGGSRIGIDYGVLGVRFPTAFTWITQGLLLGRPLVPSLPWAWAAVLVFFLVYLLLNVVFEQPIGAVADTLAARPLSAFGTGLLVLLLIGPVCFLLAVSVVGIAVVPLILCALFVALVSGKVAGARWIGMRLLPVTLTPRSHAVLAFVTGFTVITVAYMVPLLGFVTWTMMSVLGLGASAMAFVAAYRRESPPPLRPQPASGLASPIPPQYSQETIMSADSGAVAFPQQALGVDPPASTAAAVAVLPHAAFRDRIAAGVLDFILVMLTYRLVDFDLDNRFLLYLLAYHIGFWAWKGATVGGIICQLRVMRTDGAPLRFADALVRGLSAIFSIAVVGLGMLWILRDPERQAWHDRIAGTYVVKVPRNWPL